MIQSVPSRQGMHQPQHLVLVELDGAEGELDDGDGLVEHDDAAGAEHGAGLGHLVEVEADVDLVGLEDGAG